MSGSIRRKAAASLVALVLATAACGGGDDADEGATGSGEPSASAEAGFNADATLRIAATSTPSNLDPHTPTRSSDQTFAMMVYDRLFFLSQDLEIEPMLATEWAFSDDGLTLDLTLRSDVTFSDGEAFDADAVKANLDRALTLPESTVVGDLEAIEEVEVVDDGTVRFHLNAPAANLLNALAGSAGMMVSPAALDAPDLSTNPVGSGPYRVVEFVPNDHVVFEANTDYWGEGTPTVGQLDIKLISESDTRMAALRAGELDLILLKEDQLSQARDLDAGGEFNLVELPTTRTYALLFNTERSEFGSKEVRQAFSAAINRQEIVDGLLEGACNVTSQYVPEGLPAHNPDLDELADYDPDRAQELLADAGLPDGFSFEMLQFSDLAPYADLSQAVQGQLAEVGVTAEITPMESSQVTPAFTVDKSFDALTFNVRGRATAYDVYADLLTGSESTVTPSQEVLDLLARSNDATISQEERDGVLKELAAKVADEMYAVPICHPNAYFLAAPNVTGADTITWAFAGILEPRYVGLEQ